MTTARAIQHLQRWYRDRMGNGKTFRLHDPVTETRALPHPQGWYAGHPAGDDRTQWFWLNALKDGFAATGGRFRDPANRWVFYIDAENGPDQAVGGNAGVALLPQHDLMGLIGQSVFASERQVCRWVGGLGHELGHAFELPHPSGVFPLDRSAGSLMGHGFRSYPETFLNPDDVEKLEASPFFAHEQLEEPAFSCSQLRERDDRTS